MFSKTADRVASSQRKGAVAALIMSRRKLSQTTTTALRRDLFAMPIRLDAK
jgi:hypothetical protein